MKRTTRRNVRFNKEYLKGRSYLEEIFEKKIRAYMIPQPVREFKFKQYRFDFAWPILKVAVEIDGGTYIGGAHVRGKGYERDCKKNNLAQVEGWVVLRADRNMVKTAEFAKLVRKMISRRIILKRNKELSY